MLARLFRVHFHDALMRDPFLPNAVPALPPFSRGLSLAHFHDAQGPDRFLPGGALGCLLLLPARFLSLFLMFI